MIPHKKYMELALQIAEKGRGTTSPNPMVGAIIVKRGKIIGKGFHKKAGTEHAEIYALREAGKKAKNATLYVNLEPCSHWGRTPPCTESIVDAGIREVVIGIKDPNPKVEGFKELKFRGIKTRIGILEDESKKLNEAYIKHMKKELPFVILKVAMTLDGKIATKTGESKYITSSAARTYVHQIRNDVDAVLVGINTVVKDNPHLDARLVNGIDPIKIVVDSQLRIPLTCNILKTPHKAIIATTRKASTAKINQLQHKGAKVLIINSKEGKVDLEILMKELGKMDITSIMIEGGSEINGEAIKAGIVDKILCFSAPKIMGNGLSAISNLSIDKLNKAITLKDISTKKIGKDILIEGYL